MLLGNTHVLLGKAKCLVPYTSLPTAFQFTVSDLFGISVLLKNRLFRNFEKLK